MLSERESGGHSPRDTDTEAGGREDTWAQVCRAAGDPRAVMGCGRRSGVPWTLLSVLWALTAEPPFPLGLVAPAVLVTAGGC